MQPRPPVPPSNARGNGRCCIIFNPTARGEKARQTARFLDTLVAEADLRPTSGPGAARSLARQAVAEGYSQVVAAGGDGTVYEVLNGIAEAADGFTRAALGIIPLGTANVLAHELGLPFDPHQAWNVIRSGHLRSIDCGEADFRDDSGAPRQARFAVVAGAGLDARAVQLVDWSLKKRAGKLAYIAAALRALVQYRDHLQCTLDGRPFRGRVVLAGNGRLYAGELAVFPDGALDSGRLHVRGVPSVTPGILLACLQAYTTGRWPLEGRLPAAAVSELQLEADRPVPLQLDGEFVGWLPAALRIQPGALRVLAPLPPPR